MDAQNLKARTKRFALDIIELSTTLPRNPVCDGLGRQMIRSGTGLSANYRAACRAKSKADFAYKIAVCEEEADETAHWLELLIESGQMDSERCKRLLKEADELTAIMYTSKMTARRGIDSRSKKAIPQSKL